MSTAWPPLLNVHSFPPGGGFRFFEAATGWTIRGESFDVTVTKYWDHCQANPGRGLPNSREECANRVATFVCADCNYDSRYCEQPETHQTPGVNNVQSVKTAAPPPKCKTCGTK